MLERKEKMIMLMLCDICKGKKSYLISATQIAELMSKKYILSIPEIDDILISLNKDNYIDVVFSDGNKGYFYCISLKNKGITFKKDLSKQKKDVLILVARTLLLTVMSFVIGLLLKSIFS